MTGISPLLFFPLLFLQSQSFCSNNRDQETMSGGEIVIMRIGSERWPPAK